MASELYEISISRDSTAVTRAGFGVQLILGASNKFPEHYRVYDVTGSTPLAGLEADGFTAADPEHRAVTRAVSSSAKPSKVVVAQAVNRPTQVWTITPYGAVAEGKVYKLKVSGREVTYTTPAAPTLASVCTGIDAAIEAALAVAPAIVTSTVTATATNVGITASGPGVFVPVVALTRGTLSVEQTHADPGVAAELSALLLEVQAANGAADWYAINLCFPSTATVLAAAEWTEANGRFLLVASNDTRMVRAPVVGDLDIASQLLAFAYTRTAVIFHHDPDRFADAGWAGRCLPLTPGTETWVHKTVGGLDVTDLTGDERTQLQARRVSYYVSAHGVNMVLGVPGGQTFSGEYIDNLRGLDELSARLGENWTAANADVDKKTGYDDPGFQRAAGIVERTLRGYESGRNDPRLFRAESVTVTVPRVDDVTAADAENRVVPISWTAVLAQASQKAVITGTLR